MSLFPPQPVPCLAQNKVIMYIYSSFQLSRDIPRDYNRYIVRRIDEQCRWHVIRHRQVDTAGRLGLCRCLPFKSGDRTSQSMVAHKQNSC